MTTAVRTRPTWGALTRDRFVVEIKDFTRSREQMIFIFFFPLILLVLLSAMLGDQKVGDTGISFTQYLLAGMIASGIFYTGFQSPAMAIAIDRDLDLLKRIRATPLPSSSFFAAKIAQVFVVSVVQLFMLLLVGTLVYDITLPTEASKWVTFSWVFVLAVASSTALGIAASSILRNGKAASAILTPVVLALQFISGIFYVYTALPLALQRIAEVFPLKWIAQGMRSVFLPDSFAAAEARGSWEHAAIAAVLIVWLVIGLVVAIRTFRWQRADDR